MRRISPEIDLSRAIGGKFLVDDISVQVDAGEILAVVGPSGALTQIIQHGAFIPTPDGRGR
jgi:ABC-type hemin transport system ATPase subunit